MNGRGGRPAIGILSLSRRPAIGILSSAGHRHPLAVRAIDKAAKPEKPEKTGWKHEKAYGAAVGAVGAMSGGLIQSE